MKNTTNTNTKQKYIAVVNWWTELLANAFPPPRIVPNKIQMPYFVREAEKRLKEL